MTGFVEPTLDDALADGPALPYHGTAGFSGSETSKEAAVAEASDGTAAARQREVIRMLRRYQGWGVTVREVGSALHVHHGKASSVLSVLHRRGDIARLANVRRVNCAVYVLPEHVADRAVAAHGRRDPVDETLREWLVPPTPDPQTGMGGVSRAFADPTGFVAAMRAVTGYGAH